MNKYAIIETESQYIPGDERSKTHPGHGYPATTVKYRVIKDFENREAWEDWIERETKNGTEFTAIIYKEVEVKVTTNIEISE